MMKIILTFFLLFHTSIFGNNSLDEIDLILRNGDQFSFRPYKIDKRESLWFIEGTDTLFTGRIEIFSDDKNRNKIAECTIIEGMKNGYFKQYYNQERMLPGIMGLYVDNKKEGNWLWVEAGELRKNKKWFDSSARIVTSLDYMQGNEHGTILVFKTNIPMSNHIEPLPHNISDVLLKGEFEHRKRVGTWYFNDQVSSDYDQLYESKYSEQLSMHWTRKNTYQKDKIIQTQCREPWERHIDCDDYKNKYSNNIYRVPNRDIPILEEAIRNFDHSMGTVRDLYGNDVNVDIVELIEHIEEFHTSSVSRHKQQGHIFIINDDFRRIINNKILD